MRAWPGLLLLLACSEGVTLLPAPDGGAALEDASPADASQVAAPDAGAILDASQVADAGAVPDAGVALDASPLEDVGPRFDASWVLDASPEDGSIPAATAPDAGAAPFDRVAGLSLYANLGDSIGAGYNASSGRGYATLLYRNHAAYPQDALDNLLARYPSSRFDSRAHSGDTSDDLPGQVRRLPDPGRGDTLVTIYVGGNDFNDDVTTMLSATLTRAAITRWEQNLDTALDRLDARYAASGRRLLVLLATIHDPTGGTGEVPARFTSGFCGTLHDPRLLPALRARVLQNLASFNDAIRAFASRRGAVLIDSHALFLAHGMNAADPDRWIDSDCIHFTNEGHHRLRREIWRLLEGR